MTSEQAKQLRADLMDALRPFAEACAHLDPRLPDDGQTLDGFLVAEFRWAAAVYSRASLIDADTGVSIHASAQEATCGTDTPTSALGKPATIDDTGEGRS